MVTSGGGAAAADDHHDNLPVYSKLTCKNNMCIYIYIIYVFIHALH